MRLALAVLLCAAAAALLLLGRDAPPARPPVPVTVVEEPAIHGGTAPQGAVSERYAAVVRLKYDREAAIAAIPELLAVVASGEIGWHGSTEPEHRLRQAAYDALVCLGPAASPALPELLRWLEGEGDDLASTAGSLLRSLGKEAAPALPTILAIFEDPERRWARGTYLFGVLENFGPEAAAAAPSLLTMIHESAVATRKMREKGDFCDWGTSPAAGALAAMGEKGVEALITGLGDPERDARWTAAWTLARIEAAAPGLVDALSHGDPHVREGAAMALGDSKALGDAVRDALVRALLDPSVGVRREASEHLARQGPLVVPALAAALRDPDPWVRGNAARGIATLGVDAQQAVSDLVRLLKDPQSDVRAAAAAALGSMGGAGADVVPMLVDALAEEDAHARERIAASVGRIGPVAVPALVAALGSPDRNVRAAAARALRHTGDLDAPTRLHLRDRLADGDPTVRLEAAAALAEPCAIEILEAGLVAEDQNRELAVDAIARMGSAAVKSLPALFEAERRIGKEIEGAKPTPWCLDALDRALVAVGSHDIPRVVAALADESDWVRDAALRALVKIDCPIQAYFGAASPPVRVQLVQVVGGRSAVDPDKVEADMAVVRAALADPDVRVRVAAAGVVWSRDKDARAALPVLVAALAGEEETASSAASWIAGIGKDAAFMEEELRRHAGSPKHMVGYYVTQALMAIEDDAAAKR